VRVEFIRNFYKLTKKDFCKLIKITEPAYQNYLQKKRDLPLVIIYNLSIHYHISTDWLIRGIEPMYSLINADKLMFDEHDTIFETLTSDEIAQSLYFAYMEKCILPIFKNIGEERPLWRKIFNGHRDRIGSILYLLLSLKDINTSSTITIENAKKLLVDAINKHIVTWFDHLKFIYLTKDETLNAIEKLDDLGCYIILKNSQMIYEVLSPFLTKMHHKAIQK